MPSQPTVTLLPRRHHGVYICMIMSLTPIFPTRLSSGGQEPCLSPQPLTASFPPHINTLSKIPAWLYTFTFHSIPLHLILYNVSNIKWVKKKKIFKKLFHTPLKLYKMLPGTKSSALRKEKLGLRHPAKGYFSLLFFSCPNPYQLEDAIGVFTWTNSAATLSRSERGSSWRAWTNDSQST